MDQTEPLVCKTHTTTYVALFVVGLTIGIFASGWISKLNTPAGVTGANTYEAGWNAAKARLAASPHLGMMMNRSGEVKSVSGTVESISGNRITIKIKPLEPLASPTLDSRIVTITNTTKITKMIPRDPQTVQKEMDAFMKSIQTPPKAGTQMITPPMPPSPSTKQDAIISDIKVGDTITVTAVENIKEIKKFTATEVQIN